MAKGGCNKCTGSCACKAKKPRAKKAPAKRVIGGRVKAPQVVIMGPTPPVANPYQTIVSSSTPGVNKSTRGMQTMETETKETKTPSLSEFVSTPPPSLVKGAIKEALKPSRKINPSRLLREAETQTQPATLKEFLSTRSPSLVQGALKSALKPPIETEKPKKSYKAGFMSILPEAIRLENVRQRAIVQKPSMTTMETQTEPLEVKVAKGQRKSIFDVMQEQEKTGKVVALTGAGRPPFSANLETALEAAGAPARAPAPESPE